MLYVEKVGVLTVDSLTQEALEGPLPPEVLVGPFHKRDVCLQVRCQFHI